VARPGHNAMNCAGSPWVCIKSSFTI